MRAAATAAPRPQRLCGRRLLWREPGPRRRRLRLWRRRLEVRASFLSNIYRLSPFYLSSIYLSIDRSIDLSSLIYLSIYLAIYPRLCAHVARRAELAELGLHLGAISLELLVLLPDEG